MKTAISFSDVCKIHYSNLSYCEKLYVSGDYDKGLASALVKCLQNAIRFMCLFHVLKNV